LSDTTDILTAERGDAPGQGVLPTTGADAGTSATTTAGANGAAGEAGDAAGSAGTAAGRTRRRGSGLSAMVLPELKALAASLGIRGTTGMRKSELIAAISARQGGTNGGAAPAAERPATAAPPAAARAADSGEASAPAPERPPAGGEEATAPRRAERTRRASRSAGAPTPAQPGADSALQESSAPGAPSPANPPTEVRRPQDEIAVTLETRRAPEGGTAQPELPVAEPPGPSERGEERGERSERADRSERNGRRPERQDRSERQDRPERQDRSERQDRPDRQDRGERPTRGERTDRGDRNERSDRGQDRTDRGDRDRAAAAGAGDRDGGPANGPDDDFESGRGARRRGRFRERNRRGTRERFGGAGDVPEPVVSDDDVLLPVAGIVDILDSYAFVRTSGYLSGPNDVYVSLAQVRRYGLRRGDAVTGAVRQPREGERRDKFNALVRLDTVNGAEPDAGRDRPEFHKLTPLYPQDRLRLETEPNVLTTRVIDLLMPLGKGQRALIVSPPKAGKTMVLQAIANAITTNNPECHLMVVLVDERPEEVTDMQRSVKGEVIASTFDRPPADHTTVAELSIERAKRLVELGHDVVVLLDSITRLGRAYNLAAPASGRILSGGVDSTALYPPKRFLGAARNIEHGGSLTILATALVETGSTMDTVIFEEFKGTGNAEIKLDRRLADKRIFPAVDIDQSGTRKEELLLAPDELNIVIKLRRVLHALESQQAMDLLLDKLKNTRNNVEFLMQIQKTTVGPQD